MQFSLVLGCGLITLCVGAKFGCTPTTDSKGHGLGVVQGPDLNKDWCSNMESHDTVDKIMDKCELFCGAGRVPFLVGIPTYGFALGEIDQICLPDADQNLENEASSTVMTYDPTTMQNCKAWGQALNRIKRRTADFVAALDNMTYAELVFRACIHDSVAKLSDAVGSPETKETIMMAESDTERMPTYLQVVNSHLKDILSDGECRRDLRAAMSRLQEAGKTLKKSMDDNLPSVRNYFKMCDKMFVATGTSNEYLLDVCNVISPNCLSPEDDNSKHVGCCCGTVPLTDNYNIQWSGRRLSDNAGSDESEEGEKMVDVCGAASKSFNPDKATKMATLKKTAAGRNILSNYETALKESYPDYKTCGNRRLAGSLQDAAEDVRLGARSRSSIEKVSRRLKKLTTCEPQRATLQGLNETLRAAFWKDTETDYCSKVTDTNGLMETCETFCGKNSVPLLLGGTTFGFNQSSMDSVCISPGEPVELGSRTVAQCHKDAKSLHAVRVKSAKFIADLAILEARKLEFTAEIMDTVKRMTDDIKAQAAGRIDDAEVGAKINALRDLLNELTSELTSGSVGSGARFHLSQATDSLGKSSNELQDELDKAIPALDDLLNKCDRLFTGIGSEQEYLLDLCSQTSTTCIEKNTARHAGCCCGYMPLLALGSQNTPVDTIPGLSGSLLDFDAETPRARVAARRLETSTLVFHTCAESEKDSEIQVNEAEANVKELGYEYLLADAEAALKAKYPDHYSCPLPEFTCETQTGGTCGFMGGCHGSRNAECRDGKCVCGGGRCVAPSSPGRCISRADAEEEHANNMIETSFANIQRPTLLMFLLGTAVCIGWFTPHSQVMG